MKRFENCLGAIVGDVVGSRFEFNNYRSKDFELLSSKCEFTDDSILTIAVADILLNNKDVIKTFQYYCRKYPSSYGLRFNEWIYTNNPKPYNSFGNGSAMRVSFVGWFANSEEEVKELSKKVTEVTHNHPEGIKGAEVTAMCVYYARIGKSKEFIKNYVSKYYDLDFDYNDLVENYYFNEICQDTVPQAIYCFLISKDFEDCIRTSVSIGGDTDTLCAISCAIASAYYDNGYEISKAVFDNYLNEELRDVLLKVKKKLFNE